MTFTEFQMGRLKLGIILEIEIIKKLEREKGYNRKRFPKLILTLKINFECQI